MKITPVMTVIIMVVLLSGFRKSTTSQTKARARCITPLMIDG